MSKNQIHVKPVGGLKVGIGNPNSDEEKSRRERAKAVLTKADQVYDHHRPISVSRILDWLKFWRWPARLSRLLRSHRCRQK